MRNYSFIDLRMGYRYQNLIKVSKPTRMPSLFAEVSPQLLDDLRECVETSDTGDTAQTGIELLEDMKDRLSLAGREMQRTEDEGGPPLKPPQKGESERMPASKPAH